MGLADHGEAVSKSGTTPGLLQIDKVMNALDPKEAKLLRSWLEDGDGWPANRIARALNRMADAEARDDISTSHANIQTWRRKNKVRVNGS